MKRNIKGLALSTFDKLSVNLSKGFTLIELLVVMAILAVLALVGFANFRSMQIKSRDIRRKSDLEQMQRALEMYNNDYGSYPDASVGKIAIGLVVFDWGDEFKDIHPNPDGSIKGTVYMKELPKDSGVIPYCYWSDGSSYKLYAQLENSQDPKCLDGSCATARSCSGSTYTYNYGVSSSDTLP